MTYTLEDANKLMALFGKEVDVFHYDDGSVSYRPLKPEWPDFGGKDWISAIESGIRKYQKLGLI